MLKQKKKKNAIAKSISTSQKKFTIDNRERLTKDELLEEIRKKIQHVLKKY